MHFFLKAYLASNEYGCPFEAALTCGKNSLVVYFLIGLYTDILSPEWTSWTIAEYFLSLRLSLFVIFCYFHNPLPSSSAFCEIPFN